MKLAATTKYNELMAPRVSERESKREKVSYSGHKGMRMEGNEMVNAIASSINIVFNEIVLDFFSRGCVRIW